MQGLVIAPFAVTGSFFFTSSIALITASGEECYDLIRSSPTKATEVFRYKFYAAMFLPTLFILTCAGTLVFLGYYVGALLSSALGLLCAATTAWNEICRVKPTPRHDLLKNPASRLSANSLPSLLLSICGGAAVSLLLMKNWLAGYIFLGITLAGIVLLTLTSKPRSLENA
jgi:hypothetical protein